MKRSNTLLTANILSTIYSTYLLYTFGSAVIEAGGWDFIEALEKYFKAVFDILDMRSTETVILYIALILLLVHIVTFFIGALSGWIAYIVKKSGGAKFAATLYLIATICFPIFLFFGLPLTIIGYTGAGKQKKLNKANEIA